MFTTLDMHILEILCEDARVTPREIAVMTGSDEATVQAVIEVNVVPQREKGFDAIAQRIMQYDEVRSLYLMSGAYDLMVLCEARTLKELAQFVHSRLSVIEGVTGTSTHFMLKTYKYGGMIFESGADDRRQAVMP